jgi:type II secretory pathway component PulF
MPNPTDLAHLTAHLRALLSQGLTLADAIAVARRDLASRALAPCDVTVDGEPVAAWLEEAAA